MGLIGNCSSQRTTCLQQADPQRPTVVVDVGDDHFDDIVRYPTPDNRTTQDEAASLDGRELSRMGM